MKLLFKQLVAEFCNGGAPSAEDVAIDANNVPFWLTGKALATRLGKSTAWLSKLKKKSGEAFSDAIAQIDPNGYRWKWHERKFYYAIAPGASDDNGAKALSFYD